MCFYLIMKLFEFHFTVHVKHQSSVRWSYLYCVTLHENYF